MNAFDKVACIAAALQMHETRLRRFVAARVNAELVDDVRQAAALRAIERAATLRDRDRVVPWLYRIHANAATDALRKSASDRRLAEALEQQAEPVAPANEDWCGCSIAQTRRLSPKYAAILDMVDLRGLSLTEASQVLNISINNATVRLHRARAALKKRLFDHCGVTSVHACVDCRCTIDGCCSI